MRSLRVLGLATLLGVAVLVSGGVSVGTTVGPVAAQPVDDPAPEDPPGSDVIEGTPISWSIVPADADATPADSVSFRLSLDPGETVTEHVLVTNHSDVPVTFEIQASDGVISPSGAFDVLPPGEESTDVGSWIVVQPLVAAGPGESVLVPFTLTVPDDAAPGDHPGGIVAGVTTGAAGEGGPQVGMTSRVGVRVHLRVTGEIEPTVAITDVDVRYDPSLNPFAPGRLEVSYTVTNTGNVRLGSRQQADIAGLFGLPTGADTGESGLVGEQAEILPGQSADVAAEIEGVWPLGRVTTEIVASQQAAGADTPFEVVELVSATAAVWAVPWTQLLVLLVVVGLLVLWRLRRRAQRQRVDRLVAAARAEGERAGAANRPDDEALIGTNGSGGEHPAAAANGDDPPLVELTPLGQPGERDRP